MYSLITTFHWIRFLIVCGSFGNLLNLSLAYWTWPTVCARVNNCIYHSGFNLLTEKTRKKSQMYSPRLSIWAIHAFFNRLQKRGGSQFFEIFIFYVGMFSPITRITTISDEFFSRKICCLSSQTSVEKTEMCRRHENPWKSTTTPLAFRKNRNETIRIS